MSAYAETKTSFKEKSLLVKALQELGFEPLVSEEAQRLEGYRGDKREDTAEVIIPRRQVGRMSNDIGFKRQADGTFKAIISDYDSSRYDEKWLNRVKVGYTTAGTMLQAQKMGLRLVGKEKKNGKVQLKFLQA